jgi:hypothetical protein
MNFNDINRGTTTRRFILENVEAYPATIAKQTEQKFSISRQAVSKHIRLLLLSGQLEGEGVTRNRRYWLKILNEKSITITLKKDLDEQVVWQEKIAPQLSNLPSRVTKIWRDGFIKMLNNAIVHSGGKKVIITLRQTAVTTEIRIADDGEGIFKKIQNAHQLDNGKSAMLALSKGKLTTDPKNHAGKGISFTNKKFDDFVITSKGTLYAPKHPSDWKPESLRSPKKGTLVLMKLNNKTVLTPIV